MNHTQLSKQLSYILRHAPWEYELELDDEGWVSLTQLLDALQSEPHLRGATEEDIHQILSLSFSPNRSFFLKGVRASITIRGNRYEESNQRRNRFYSVSVGGYGRDADLLSTRR